jgi:uncharacterized membrane protein YecN with MAPEG domain
MKSTTLWHVKIKRMAVEDNKLKKGEKSISILKLTVMILTYKAVKGRDKEKQWHKETETIVVFYFIALHELINEGIYIQVR